MAVVVKQCIQLASITYIEFAQWCLNALKIPDYDGHTSY